MDFERIDEMRERLLTCVICMGEYKDPRLLPCHHSFCLKCITDMLASSSSQYFCCPQCRRNVTIQKDEIHKLPVNFYAVSLQDELSAKVLPGKCHICAREHIHPQFHCIDCDVDICKFCISFHRLEEHGERSNIVRNTLPHVSSHLNISNFCKDHISEMVQLFCHMCHQAICINCSCINHKGHNIAPLSTHLKETKLFMKKGLDEIVLKLERASRSKSLIETVKKDIINTSNKSLLNLDDIADKACQSIMKVKSGIEEDIRHSAKVQLDGIESVEKKLQTYTDMLDKGQDFLTDLQEDDICMEVIDSYKKYLANLNEKQATYTASDVPIQHNHFIPKQGLMALDFHFGTVWNPSFLYGSLGYLQQKKLKMCIDSKTLDINFKRGSFFDEKYKRLCLFIISFLFFNCAFSLLDNATASLNLLHWYSLITDMGARAFDDLLCSCSLITDAAAKLFEYLLSLYSLIIDISAKTFEYLMCLCSFITNMVAKAFEYVLSLCSLMADVGAKVLENFFSLITDVFSKERLLSSCSLMTDMGAKAFEYLMSLWSFVSNMVDKVFEGLLSLCLLTTGIVASAFLELLHWCHQILQRL